MNNVLGGDHAQPAKGERAEVALDGLGESGPAADEPVRHAARTEAMSRRRSVILLPAPRKPVPLMPAERPHSTRRDACRLTVAVAVLAACLLPAPALAQAPATASFGKVENRRSFGRTLFALAGPDGTRAQVTFARRGTEVARTPIFALDGYPAAYDWSCDDGGSYTATVRSFDAAGAVIAGSEQVVRFAVPFRPCRDRLIFAKEDGRSTIRAGRRFRIQIVDRWNASGRALWMRACVRSARNGTTCRDFRSRQKVLTLRAPSTVRRLTFTLSAPGEPTIKTVRRRYRILGSHPPRPKPKPRRPSAPAPDCSPSVCHDLAVEATRKIARAIYYDDDDALDYGARCRAVTRARFDCIAWVSGVITHSLVGEGERYRCDYDVTTTIRGDTAHADRSNGGIRSTGGPKNCVGIGD
jgi:hypothetical protein